MTQIKRNLSELEEKLLSFIKLERDGGKEYIVSYRTVIVYYSL